MKLKNRWISSLLLLLMMLNLMPVSAKAEEALGYVKVIVENTTYSKKAGAPWDGTLVDTWVDLSADSTMMSCVAAALKTKNATVVGAESNYISSINGLGEFDKQVVDLAFGGHIDTAGRFVGQHDFASGAHQAGKHTFLLVAAREVLSSRGRARRLDAKPVDQPIDDVLFQPQGKQSAPQDPAKACGHDVESDALDEK